MNVANTRLIRVARSFATVVRRTCFWLTGLPSEELLKHRIDTQMRYTGAGSVVLIWFVLMCVVWGKTGAQLFGTGGAIAFLLFPALMLSLDRMILSHPRNPRGSLAAYAIPGIGVSRTQLLARSACALAFSLATTSLFLVQQNQANIRAQQHQDHFNQNSAIRSEIDGRIEARFQLLKASSDEQSQQLYARRDLAKAEYEQARTVADEAEARARNARFNASAEAGGIEGRRLGEGSRFRAFASIAQNSQDDAVNARARETRARERLLNADDELKVVKGGREQALQQYNDAKSGIHEEVQLDPRFVARKSGLFADATTLIGLYGDKQIGLGLTAGTFIAAFLLFVSELAPLIACAILPVTPYDVERIARDRADAAMSVALYELDVVSAHARRTVTVRAVEPGDARAPNANAEANAHAGGAHETTHQ